MVNKHYDLGERIQGLTLLIAGWKAADLAKIVTLSESRIYRIQRNANERGFRPENSLIILAEYVKDKPRSGRPIKATPEIEEEIQESITRDRYAREEILTQIGLEVGLLFNSILRILKRLSYRKVKPSTKPGLTKEIRAARLVFCEKYKHWTIEDWKRVIWTDETSVVLGARRGVVRVWRTILEGIQPVPSTIRRRWKGSSKMML